MRAGAPGLLRPQDGWSVTVGAAAGAVFLLLLLAGMKWSFLFVLILAAAAASLVLVRTTFPLEVLLLCVFIPTATMKLDVHLIHTETEYLFAVRPEDVAWLGLMAVWYARVRFTGQAVRLPRAFVLLFVVLIAGAVVAGLRHESTVTGVRYALVVGQGALLFLYLLNRRFTERECTQLYLVMGLTMVGQASIGFLQAASGSALGLEARYSYMLMAPGQEAFSRVGGTFSGPNPLARFLNSFLLVPLLVMVQGRSLWLRASGAVFFGVGATALLLTKSRGGWLAASAALALVLYLYLRRRRSRPFAGAVLLWGSVALILAVLIVPMTRQRLIADDYGSAASRVPMSLTALRMIADHPVFGVGLQNYTREFHRYDVTPEGQTYEFRWPVHNAYLLLAAESGVVTALAFLAFLALR